VLTEAAHLLVGQAGFHLVEQLLNSCGTGFLEILTLGDSHAQAVARFLEKDRDQAPDLADAALVHLAERERIEHVFTLDRGDFSVYRTASGRALTLLPRA
jgi:predicted nucleic acid-binding protein